MRSRKPGVIKGSAGPPGCGVASFTRRWKRRRCVIWIGRAGIIGRVTRIATRVSELIISIRVARLTRCCDVHSSQRKLRAVVVERRRLPRGGRMAKLTRCGEPACHMIGRCGGSELSLVAGVAIRGGRPIIPALMTLLTCHRPMCAR